MWLYASCSFLGAFLLFHLEPMVGKHLLPAFGGSASVWTTCLLFFQIVLLAGYTLVHALDRLRGGKAQAVCLLVLLVASAALLLWQTANWGRTLLAPLESASSWLSSPAVGILKELSSGVGLPFLLLTMTSPLVQAWARSGPGGESPWWLYSLSNAGSLAALLGFPFLLERWFSLRLLSWLWTGLFFLYSVLMTVAARRVWRTPYLRTGRGRLDFSENRPSSHCWWIVLSAAGCAMLMAVTNRLCQDLASVPLLWVAPLALYLLSFVLAFGKRRWYRRGLFGSLYLLFSLACLALVLYGPDFILSGQLLALLGLLFCGCMVFHGELFRLRPSSGRLTRFYLMSSLGGALGGAFVSLAAPLLFDDYYEFQLALFGGAFLFWLVLARDQQSLFYRGRRTLRRLAATALLLGGGLVLLFDAQTEKASMLWSRRSFYGVHRVKLSGTDGLMLLHGNTIHGVQRMNPWRRQAPTTYYAESSGVGHAILYHPRRLSGLPLRIGVVGLGVGTIASYGRPGDRIVFYELDPQVEKIALGEGGFFDYLENSAADIEVRLGDARLTMQAELAAGRRQGFDVLAVDAFSSDSIPVHLLTREAVDLYAQHLAPDGILALHVSNRSLRLAPLAQKLAGQAGFTTAVFSNDYGEELPYPSTQVLG